MDMQSVPFIQQYIYFNIQSPYNSSTVDPFSLRPLGV